MLVLVLGTVFAVSSCKDDDEEDKKIENNIVNTENSIIIGTWRISHGPDAYSLYTFNADGTVIVKVYEFGDTDIDSGKYSYAKNILTIIDSDGDYYIFNINWISNDIFTARDEDGYVVTFVRQ